MRLDRGTSTRFAALATCAILGITTVVPVLAGTDRRDPWPGDLSPAGARAAFSTGALDAESYEGLMPPEVLDAARNYVQETRAAGLKGRAGKVDFMLGTPNVRANNPAGDAIGETQSEISVAVYGDTVVVAWNDSKGFLAGSTLSSYAYSTDGAVTFTDGGNVPLALPTDQAFGDTDVDTDGEGNWYLVSIYTRTGPTQQNMAVWNGTFIAGVLTWNLPVQASIGTSATGNLDKCYLACDRDVTGNVYVGYTRFTATPQIEMVRSVDKGATWNPPVILDNTAVPTASKQCANPYVGPGGEVYVVWEKGANLINCPDGSGNVGSVNAQIAFTKSVDFGLTYAPFSIIGTPVTDFMAAGPGDLRERGNEFPDIVVDRSGCPNRGRIYVTWHESAPWTSNIANGPVRAEAADAANNNPGGAELFLVGENVTGTISSNTDLDYWMFDAVQGQDYFMNLDPQGFNCGVSGTTRGMRLRLFASQGAYTPPTGFPDSLLAASSQGTFAQRITWTCPRTGRYLLRTQRVTTGVVPFTYTIKVRPMTFSPIPNGARDTRDVVLTTSGDGGATWSVPKRINDDAAGLENRRPFMAVDDRGRVSVFWHDSRLAGIGSTASLTTVWATTSRDGGVTWSPNYSVSDDFSFFSFNTLAIPNLGDYNMAAASGDMTIAGWTDQRLSGGEVRDPVTGVYTAGPGPDAYTAKVSFSSQAICPPNQGISGGSPTVLQFCIQNTGTAPDSYVLNLADANGWYAGPPSVNSGVIPPGGIFCFPALFVPPGDCSPSLVDVVTAVWSPVGGEACDRRPCETVLQCEPVVPTYLTYFDAVEEHAGGVTLTWAAQSTPDVVGFNVYRGASAELAVERVNAVTIPATSDGIYTIVDSDAPGGAVWYRLMAVHRDGDEVFSGQTSLNVTATPRSYSFRLAGPNPFSLSVGTQFAYTLPERANVRIGVYNVAGQLVRAITPGEQDAGAYSVPLGAGRSLASGAYLVKFSAGSFQRTVRVIATP